jgi:hypothetical protein
MLPKGSRTIGDLILKHKAMTDSQRTKEEEKLDEILSENTLKFGGELHRYTGRVVATSMKEYAEWYASQEVKKAQEGGLREIVESLIKFEDDCEISWDIKNNDSEIGREFKELITNARAALSSPQPDTMRWPTEEEIEDIWASHAHSFGSFKSWQAAITWLKKRLYEPPITPKQ